MGLSLVGVIRQASAEIRYAKVLGVFGRADIYRPPSPSRSLEPSVLLKKGQKIVTGDKSEVELGFNDEFTGLAKLGERSRLSVMSETAFLFFLEHGDLFVLREDLGGNKNPLKVLTRDFQVDIEQGGCRIQVSGRGTRVKVFGERVKLTRPKRGPPRPGIKDRELEEGFQIFLASRSNDAWRVTRLTYDDYDPWQVWVRKAYERKDDWEADRSERENTP